MRVTKVIREYIEEKVAEKLPYPEKPKDSLEEELAQVMKEMLVAAKAKLKEFAYQHKGEFYFGWSGCDYDNFEGQCKYIDNELEIRGCSCIHSKEEEEYKKLRKDIQDKRKEAVKDIIITLELGGTKAELEEMLAKVGA
jgi:hypothetical protein